MLLTAYEVEVKLTTELCILSCILPVHACILHFAEKACSELYGDNALFQHTVTWLLCSSVSAVGMSKACCDAVPRIGENALAVFLIFSVYWKLGDRMSAQDVPNIGGLLFLWVTVPAYGAAAYTPVCHVTALLHVAVTRQLFAAATTESRILPGTAYTPIHLRNSLLVVVPRHSHVQYNHVQLLFMAAIVSAAAAAGAGAMCAQPTLLTKMTIATVTRTTAANQPTTS